MNRKHFCIPIAVALLAQGACVAPLPTTEMNTRRSEVTPNTAITTTTGSDASQAALAVKVQAQATTTVLPLPSDEASSNPSTAATSTANMEMTPAACESCEATTEPTVIKDENLLEVCRMPAGPASGEAANNIYVRIGDDSMDDDGWYLTDDLLTMAEPIAPWGYLSRDLKYLVTFGCDGIGSICVASPPQAEPMVLPVRYELDYDPRNTLPPSHRAYWMADNKRLVFRVLTSFKNPEDYSDFTRDERLYLLNVETGDVETLAGVAGDSMDFVVSPVGECVMVHHEIDGTAEVIALGRDGVRDSLRLPDDITRGLSFRVDYDWSPDGRRIATTGRDGNIQIVDLQTNSLQSIVPCDHCLVTGLRWSPDSSRLFFSDVDSLYVVYPDTEKIELVGASWGVSSTQQTYWLPDGKSLVFEGSRSYGPILYRLSDNEKPPYHEPVTFGDETKRWTVSYLFWTSQEVSSRSLQ